MECPRCKTTNPKYFAKVGERYYCRRCIGFGRVFCDEVFSMQKDVPLLSKHVYYQLGYELSKAQKNLSECLVHNVQQQRDSVVLAVCGSGKTEIIYDSIAYVLNQAKRVCVAIPRKTLVVEIGERIKKQFIGIEPALFYGGHQGDENAALIICTTHQLYRFNKAFDLLVLDETDAFPYNGDPLLKDLLFHSLRGNYIFMSATLTAEQFPDAQLFILNRRYHQIDLPVPKWQRSYGQMWIWQVKRYLQQWQKPVLIFVPRIADSKKFNSMFEAYRFAAVSSKSNDIAEFIDKLRCHDLDFIVTTTILERGVTIEDVQVIVLEASHIVYTKEVLLQIAGRVGRSPRCPTGEVVFLSSQKTVAIRQCIQTIQSLNQMNA